MEKKSTYSWEAYLESDAYKEDKEIILNSNDVLDSFDRHMEESGCLSYRQLTTPFNV